jgi:nicotinate-nucleotide adenylyltransferase
MTRLAILDDPAFELSLIDAPGNASNCAPNYTVDTLSRLRQSLPPNATLFLLIGADSFRTLPHWHRAAELPFLATLIVASRPGENLDPSELPSFLPPSVTLIEEPQPIQSELGQLIHHSLRNTSGAEADLYILPGLHWDVSATALRREIHQHPIIEPLPSAVLAYIQQKHLYE